MKRDAYGRLDDNAYPLLHRLGPVTPPTPWALRLTDDTGTYRLLCFDFDGKDSSGSSPELIEQAADDCDQLSRALEDLEVQHVVCQSSSSGGRHIWIAIRGGAPASDVANLARATRAVLRTLDHGMLCNPAEGAARPPLSPHRNGSTSTVLRGSLTFLTTPQATPDALIALTHTFIALRPEPQKQQSPPSGPVDTRHKAHKPLSNAGTAHMATLNGGNNPSWTGFMCLLSASVAGWSFTDIERAAHTAPGMEHYRTKNTGRGTRRPRSARDRRNRLERQWSKAQAYAALYAPLPRITEPPDLTALETIVTDVETIFRRIHAAPGRWRTEAGQSRQSILRAVAYLTLQTGKTVVAASIRDLALMTGLGRTTAATALGALAADGLIERVTPADGLNAAEWQLSSPLSTPHGTLRSQPLNNPRPPDELFTHRSELLSTLESFLVDSRHDLFTRKGLGHLAGRLYAHLRQHTVRSPEEASRVLSSSTRHAATTLSRLHHHRLIRHTPQGWSTTRRDIRDKAAKTLGVAGVLAGRAHLYTAERQTWQWWQAELTTMNTPPGQRPRRPHVSSRPLDTDSRNKPSGERVWPRYPRSANRRADHKSARQLVLLGALNPESRFQFLGQTA
jgi:hypothetical protein